MHIVVLTRVRAAPDGCVMLSLVIKHQELRVGVDLLVVAQAWLQRSVYN